MKEYALCSCVECGFPCELLGELRRIRVDGNPAVTLCPWCLHETYGLAQIRGPTTEAEVRAVA